MQKSSAGGSSFDDEREQGGPEHVVGDADNVQKTSYVVGQGTDPSTRSPDARGPGPAASARRGSGGEEYTATVRTGGGLNVGLVVVVLIALAIALVYGFGLLG